MENFNYVFSHFSLDRYCHKSNSINLKPKTVFFSELATQTIPNRLMGPLFLQWPGLRSHFFAFFFSPFPLHFVTKNCFLSTLNLSQFIFFQVSFFLPSILSLYFVCIHTFEFFKKQWLFCKYASLTCFLHSKTFVRVIHVHLCCLFTFTTEQDSTVGIWIVSSFFANKNNIAMNILYAW